MELKGGEVLENVSTGQKKGEHGRDVVSETPRGATTGATSGVARRRLNLSTPGSNRQGGNWNDS